MKTVIEINMNNEAFMDGCNGSLELAKILRTLANGIGFVDLSEDVTITLRDSNGNTVGYCVVREG